MKNTIGEFITSPEFGKLASKAIKAAVTEANENGLQKAYSDIKNSVFTNLIECVETYNANNRKTTGKKSSL